MNKEQAAKYFHCGNIYGETTGNRVHHLVKDAFIAGATWQEQHTHPHSTYMEFAEWYATVLEDVNAMFEVRRHCGRDYTTPDLFQYWITNVKNKG